MTVPDSLRSQPPNLITAVILFVDLQGSVNLSSSLSIWDYDRLIDDYQRLLSDALGQMRERYSIPEWSVVGDELKAFFYVPGDVETQAKLAEIREKGGWHSDEYNALSQAMRAEHDRLIYGALRTAIHAKHSWVSYPTNVERIHVKQSPIELGCGINSGRVILGDRIDGRRRIEGYAINYGKRVEGTSRYGKYSQIALSRTAYEMMRNIKIAHSMLKQRVFFREIALPPDAMKGLSQSERIHEVTFFHRLAGVKVAEDQCDLFMKILLTDPSNFWAYTNLISYLLYDKGDLSESERITEFVMNSIPPSEKIYYDMAEIHFRRGDFETAREYCFMALRLNDEFDIAYNQLVDIEEAEGGDPARILEYASKAASLTPGSAMNHFALARAHLALGNEQHAKAHAERMLALYPEYPATSEKVAELLGKVGMNADTTQKTDKAK
ncbi:MAG: hypothetical protein HRF49_01200 [bacterium]|jgi:class 3 adenylate cyclase